MTNINYVLSHRFKQDGYLQFQRMLDDFQALTETATGRKCELLVKLHNARDTFMHSRDLVTPQVWASAHSITVNSYMINDESPFRQLCATAELGPPGSTSLSYSFHDNQGSNPAQDNIQPQMNRTTSKKVLPFACSRSQELSPVH